MSWVPVVTGLCSDPQPFPPRDKTMVLQSELQPVASSKLGHLPLSSGPASWLRIVPELGWSRRGRGCSVSLASPSWLCVLWAPSPVPSFLLSTIYGRGLNIPLVCGYLFCSGAIWTRAPFKPNGPASIAHLNILLYPAEVEHPCVIVFLNRPSRYFLIHSCPCLLDGLIWRSPGPWFSFILYAQTWKACKTESWMKHWPHPG